MRKFITMATIFMFPLVVGPVAALLFMPPSYFYYRPFEALLVYELTGLLSGPFYPNVEMEMIEQGDLGYYTSFAVPRKNKWVTDGYGQRTSEGDGANDIVIVGDSFVAGSGVNQDETLAAVLADRMKRRVYPYYQIDNKLFDERRFLDHPPPIIVVVCVERYILRLSLPDPDMASPRDPPVRNRRLLSIFSRLDRWLKIDYLRYARATTKRALIDALVGPNDRLSPQAVLANDGSMLFAKDDAAAPHPIEPFIAQAVAARQALQKRGVRFIIMPVPNKSTVYSDKRDGFVKTDFLERLTGGLRAAGLEVVPVERAFQEERDRGRSVYLTDDTHWNEHGIQIAAELLAQQIQEGPE